MATTQFGEAVRRWRDRVGPQDAGLPVGGHRRAPGLRREELALLAGISVDYITRLEQGRAVNPSEQIIEALARALRLADAERALLFRLGGLQPPGPDRVSARITPSVQRLLDRMTGTPVAVFDAAWTLLVANPPYAALMGDPSGWRGLERNAVWRNFLGLNNRVQQTPESRAAFLSGMVADLRSVAATYPNDPRLKQLVSELLEHSETFAELWSTGGTGDTGVHETARKTIRHPYVGDVVLDCDILTVAGSDLHIMVYSAEPGTEDAERLALLTALGTQSLDTRSSDTQSLAG
ncbi:helix-turn-helix domain-containing protein [Catenulispora sp. NL8]|uniref:Helix-turn-helix domain-containing protein n=1 Tax=Catenulispora pinistramenti TaxID=2705254 RepID=A0ABS5L5U0_9ACTN|nr:helix-turn-helix transcriptional regulator [Catenulispora pinistramenti]MBS2553615.1 helix-turn-helix domain-containing protein [Catenulispora pinistramenti]